jgi:hypothetical protein
MAPMRAANPGRRRKEGHGMVSGSSHEENREDAKERFAGHLAPAYRAMKYIAQLSTTADPTKSTKQ